MTDYSSELDEILEEFSTWDICGNDDCQHFTNYQEAKAKLETLLRRVEVDGFRNGAATEIRALQDLYKNEIKFTRRDESELRSWTQYRLKMAGKELEGVEGHHE